MTKLNECYSLGQCLKILGAKPNQNTRMYRLRKKYKLWSQRVGCIRLFLKREIDQLPQFRLRNSSSYPSVSDRDVDIDDIVGAKEAAKMIPSNHRHREHITEETLYTQSSLRGGYLETIVIDNRHFWMKSDIAGNK